MSQPPPPGWVPPGPAGPPPGYTGPAGPSGPYGAAGPAWGPPVHKPGVVALRPLRLGDFFDGAFQTIRRNPKAMVGLAAVVSTAALIVPALVTLAVAASGDLTAGSASTSTDPFTALQSQISSALVLTYVGTLFGALANTVLNGLLVQVVSEAVLGRKTTAGQAWAATRGRMLPLVGLALLGSLLSILGFGVAAGIGLAVGLAAGPIAGIAVGVLLGIAAGVLYLYLSVRFFGLASPALVLEGTGIVASLRRASQLSKDDRWRIFGIYLLAGLAAGVAGQVLAVPLGLLGGLAPLLFPGTVGALAVVFSSYLSQILVGAITTPFLSAVVALLYVDQRIRKEGLDVALIAAAGRDLPGPS